MTIIKVNRRSKGEKTRTKILEATIEVIAEVGIKGATHRAIAQKAGIQLSLTTYYFVDIKELVMEAMLLSSERYIAGGSKVLKDIFTIFDTYDAATFRKVSTREHLCEETSILITNYMYKNITERRVGLAVEQIFFTEIMYSPEFQKLAQSHIEYIKTSFLKLSKYFNKIDPEIDAELAMLALTKMEYGYLNEANENININHIKCLVKRQLGYIMGLKRQ